MLALFEQTLFIGIFNQNRCEPISHLHSNILFRMVANTANVQVCVFNRQLDKLMVQAWRKYTSCRSDGDFQPPHCSLSVRTNSINTSGRSEYPVFFCLSVEKKKSCNTYESSAKSVIWILAMRARISIRWRPSSVWSPLMERRKRRRAEGEGEWRVRRYERGGKRYRQLKKNNEN